MIDQLASQMAWCRAGGTPLLSTVGRCLLNRSFPSQARKRILLVYQDHPLAYAQFAPFLRYARRFAAHGMHFRAVRYSELNPQELPDELDALFLQSSYTPARGELEGLLSELRRANPALRIAYFDWFAPTDIRFAERVDHWVSAYVKKSLLRNRSDYLCPNVGHTNLTDYFSDCLGTDNPACEWTVPRSILSKLTVGPSFSTSLDLVGLFERRSFTKDQPRPIDLHARIATGGTPWYAAMRSEAAAAVESNFQDLNVANRGRVSKARYMRELKRSKLCFSPFGYGEICWRDFEAVAVGTVLLKPDMSHLETNPNIYRPFETYIPIQWDLSDLNERVRDALADQKRLQQIAANAFEVVRDHLQGQSLTDLAMCLVGKPSRKSRVTPVKWSQEPTFANALAR